MKQLDFYASVSGKGRLSYRLKIMLIAFVGTHVPLLAIIVYSVLQSRADLATTLWTVCVALVATLLGTAATLLVLNGMLQPVLTTSRALRRYRETREIAPLPMGFTDEAGTLMADAKATLEQLESALVELETVDAATGLPNRDKFLEIVSGTAGQGLVVLALRVDNYGKVRATYDQREADTFMRTQASRIAPVLPAGAVLARNDAGSFVVMTDADPGDLVPRLREVTGRAIAIQGVEVVPSVALGAALSPDDGAGSALVDNAITAAGNPAGAAPVTYYSPKARAEAQERFALEQDLRRAIAERQFSLNYQPVVDLAAGRAVGAEALIRWNHPVRGQVAPGLFIPTAERSGLIDQIGLWVIREACAQLACWQDAGEPALNVAINVSARQFHDPALMNVLREAMAESGVSAERLEIELTESAAMADYDHTRRTFGQLADMGVSIAIDDFGTGYASMSYLRKLPFTKLKIDREFITNVDTRPGEQAICNAVIALGHGLGLKVLAEGTERREEVAWLADRGCDLFQGYYFAKPVGAADVPETLNDIRLRLVAGGKDEGRPLARSA